MELKKDNVMCTQHSEAIEARRNKVVVLENEIAILALETWLVSSC